MDREDFDDFEFDDLVARPNKKKRKKSKDKGGRGELNVCKLLNERFKSILDSDPSLGSFTRSVGSGNRWSQAKLSRQAKKFYSGDIFCEKFRFTIESKCGYELDFAKILSGHKIVDDFLKQVESDSNRSGRDPLLIWKKDYTNPLAFIKPMDDLNLDLFKYYMIYNNWIIVDLKILLNNLPDEFFFR